MLMPSCPFDHQGVSTFILLAPVIPFIKRRVPYTSPKSSAYQRHNQTGPYPQGQEQKDKAWWKDKVLWLFSLATIAQALGFFVTVLYLPNFATSLGLKDIEGTSALAILNGEWNHTFSRIAVAQHIRRGESVLKTYRIYQLVVHSQGSVLVCSWITSLPSV